MTSRTVTAALIAAAAAGFALLTALGLAVPSGTEKLVLAGIVLASGLVAPSIVTISHRYAAAIATVAALALTGADLLFTTVLHVSDPVKGTVTALLAAIAAILIPATSHPSTHAPAG